MATIEEGLYSWVATNSPLNTLIGTRFYPLELPQSPTYPAIVYRLVGDDLPFAYGSNPGDLMTARYQFDCHGLTFSAARGLAQTLRVQLNGFTGVMGAVTVQKVQYLGENQQLATYLDQPVIPVDFRFMYKL